jgi:hypothetical protein
MIPKAAADEVDALQGRGSRVEIFDENQQCYVSVHGLDIPSPPWSANLTDILIVIPASYENAELDGFYVALPLGFNGANHPRINGGEITVKGRSWRLISWHYPDNRKWIRGQDNIETHITHCRGFFLHRGAINAY